MIRGLKALSELLNHAGIRLYGGNLLYLYSERIIAFFFSFAVGIYVARYLGPERYGLLTYALSLSSILGVLMTFGLESVMARELVSRPSERDLILGSGAGLKLAGFILLLLLQVFFLLLSGTPWESGVLVLIITSGYLFQTFQVLEYYFQSEVKSKYVSLSKIFSLLIYCILRIVLLVTGADLLWFALAEALNMLCVSLGYLYYYRVIGLRVSGWRFSLSEALRLLKCGYLFYLSSIAIVIYMRIDQVLLKDLLGSFELGLYSVSVRLVEIFYFIPVLSCASVLPSLIRAKERSEKEYLLRLEGLFGLMFYAGLFCVGLCFAGSFVVEKFYGAAYAGVDNLLRSYSWLLLFIFTSQPLAQWYIVNGTQRYGLFFAFFTALLNISLNFLLISMFGLYGAVSASLLSYFLVFLLGLCLSGTRQVMLLRLLAPLRLLYSWREILGGILR